MRAVTFVTLLSLISASLASMEEMKAFVVECAKELDIKMGADGEPDSEQAEKKCLAKCIAVKMQVMDESGKITEDKIPDEIKPLMKECSAQVKETDVCKMANEMQKCIMSKLGNR